MSSGRCCMCFYFATFGVYIDKEKKEAERRMRSEIWLSVLMAIQSWSKNLFFKMKRTLHLKYRQNTQKHRMGQSKHFLLMDVKLKWIGFLHKTVHHHTVEMWYQTFFKIHSAHVLLSHMNGPPRHLVAFPSIVIFGTKWKRTKKEREQRKKNKERERQCIKIING